MPLVLASFVFNVEMVKRTPVFSTDSHPASARRQCPPPVPATSARRVVGIQTWKQEAKRTNEQTGDQ